ncbi:hypothetical protein D3C76_1523560 [compost metagenome]
MLGVSAVHVLGHDHHGIRVAVVHEANGNAAIFHIEHPHNIEQAVIAFRLPHQQVTHSIFLAYNLEIVITGHVQFSAW